MQAREGKGGAAVGVRVLASQAAARGEPRRRRVGVEVGCVACEGGHWSELLVES